MTRKKSSSKRWLKEHFNDPFVKQAQKEGYRSRAAYKLLEIQEKDKLIKPGMTIVELGAAPGGWTQVVAKLLKGSGKVFALDLLKMDPIPDVEFIEGDFTTDEVLQTLLTKLDNQAVDLVISDMAPNTTGINVVDQLRTMHLAELVLDLATKVLKPGGSLLIKVFQGTGFMELRQAMLQVFDQVITRKPKASRARSTEAYLLARGYNYSDK